MHTSGLYHMTNSTLYLLCISETDFDSNFTNMNTSEEDTYAEVGGLNVETFDLDENQCYSSHLTP